MRTTAETPPGRGAGILLGMMLLLACCIAVGGMLVARREVETRRVRDRQPQRELARAMQGEVLKLEVLYEGHLQQTGRAVMGQASNLEAARRMAGNVEGIQRVSWLSSAKVATAETHLNLLDREAALLLPEPTLERQHAGLPRLRVLLTTSQVSQRGAARSQGWIDEPGKPLMYAVHESNSVVVLTLDRAAVERAINQHFSIWLPENLGALERLGGPDQVQKSEGSPLISVGSIPGWPPDVLAPVASRFGAWHIASWDERVSGLTYHGPTLAGALALAVLVAGCGIGLSVAQRRAALLARQRVSFVNRVSHELRTPMTNILLNLDVIEDAVPESAAGRFALVREEAGRLSRLIENVLTFSRREEGRLRLQNVRCVPGQVVDDIARQFEPALQRRGIVLTRTHEGARSEALLDADALAQITANLLSNVEKYAPNVPATVRTVQTAGSFTLVVTDAGQGIDTQDAGSVFEPFYRVDDRVEAGVSGAGLGLSIARDLAQRMGGELRLLPAEKGACFELRIPLTTRPDPTDQSDQTDPLQPKH
ncbi:MAG: sensor histidine kinase [Prosthecobacter sp.]